ncbi:biotin transporter BioY [Raoultibacter phocaeensis]|uniref:biotin transporter BioY n=1 Tax=Raoultibacter phocaeensis TaxID=2479841 RepID=UPI0011192DAB|nr:biotin transporter BioY [Raoultibacter phocaeensis]
MTGSIAKTTRSTRTRSIAFCGLTIALFAVSAWISVPLGPIPFTLQTFAMVFALIALTPGQCIASIACYLVLGAIGVPVFSSMRGGIGVILGPTGGFLWGYLIGAFVALALMALLTKWGKEAKTGSRATVRPSEAEGLHDAERAREVAEGRTAGRRAPLYGRRELAVRFIGAIVFIAIMYAFGCVQFMVVTGTGIAAAFAAAVAPFIVVDTVKTVLGVLTALAVKRAIR